MKTWKRQEIKAAEVLHGKRITKKHYGDSEPDIETWWGIGEAKSRTHLPYLITRGLAQVTPFAMRKGKIPFVVLHKKGEHCQYIIMKISDFKSLLPLDK